MSRERHATLKRIFLAACDVHGEERRALLERECGADGELRAQVEQMLGVDASGVPALAHPAAGAAPAGTDAPGGRLSPEELARLAARATARCYEVDTELARGGMGRILRARDVDLRRELAMKVSLGAPGGTPEAAGHDGVAAARFLAEARTTARLDHPGIVPVHDLGVDADGRLFFTMKLVQGRDLGALLRRARRGEEEVATARLVGVLRQVCDAVAYAHSKGVVHRDLKPANVMVGDFGEVYVMDWGIARVLDGTRGDGLAPGDGDAPGAAAPSRAAPAPGDSAALTQPGSILGTPYGMAPEQARGEPAGPAADVYAVGAMLYEVLARRRPYEELDGEPALAVLARIRAGPPAPLRRLAPAAPAELVAIAERAMAPRPEERYTDMRALSDDLRAFLEGRVVRAHRTGALAELGKWIARNRLAAAGLALALLAVVGGLLWSRQVETAGRRELDLAADYFRARVLRDSVDELWPAAPVTLPALDDWIARSERLLARRDLHAARLAALAARPEADPSELARQRALVGYLDELAGAGDGDGLLSTVRARQTFASTIEERSLGGPDAAARWREVRASVLAGDSHPAYAGLDLPPQLGLLPLGPDPDSGLHEFAHLETGEPAVRGADGRLAVRPETGLVLVLLPGGTFHLGASRDPDAPNHDPAADQNEAPVVEATLGPFFAGKFELTQAQWERVTGGNPSRWRAGEHDGATPLNPVEQVSFDDATAVLTRMGLSLPTEAQWEYACRAGSAAPFSFPGVPASAGARYANVADRHYARAFRPTYPVEDFDDGFGFHAPVGSLLPNAFGLHDVHGNVAEWVADVYASHAHPRAGPEGRSLAGTDEAGDAWQSPDSRIVRGGMFEIPLHYARASHRVNFAPTSVNHGIGLRPARAVQR